MQIILNGKSHLTKACTILELMENLGLSSKQVAIEQNLVIVPKSIYDSTTISDGDVIEVVAFVGGG